jgi:sensor histidine kinase YesM
VAKSLPQALARTLGLSAIVAVSFGAIFSITGGGFSARELGVNALVAFVYSGLIGCSATVLFRRIGPRLARTPLLRHWLVMMAILLVLTVVCSLLAGLLFIAMRLSTAAQFWPTFERGLRIALLISLISGIAAVGFDRLRHRLEATELDKQRALTLAADARLSSLESRIRPHFLFNALNTIAALIPEDPTRAEQVLERFAALLRYSLDANPSGLLPLAQELAIVVDYLEIEQARFGQRLRYRIDVPAELDAAQLPPFALQTLVENCVKYAIAPRPEGGEITLTAREAPGTLTLRVSDDGPGFAASALLPGHGLENLKARLTTLFGSAGRLEVVTGTGTGGVVVLTVPRP